MTTIYKVEVIGFPVVKWCVTRAECLGSNIGGCCFVVQFFFTIFHLSIFANSEIEPVTAPFGYVFELFEALFVFSVYLS